MTNAVRLSDNVVHLTDELGVGMIPLDGGDFWTARDRAELSSGRLLSIFRYDATWDFQERHPAGDELVFVIEGTVDLLVDTGDGDRVVALSAGCAGVVPAGGWHRLVVHEPCTVLFITPTPALTEHRDAPVASSFTG